MIGLSGLLITRRIFEGNYRSFGSVHTFNGTNLPNATTGQAPLERLKRWITGNLDHSTYTL